MKEKENLYYEKKSIVVIKENSKHKDLEKDGNNKYKDLAKDCVCFANSKGGIIYIGIEDKEDLPPANQIITDEKAEEVEKRIRELTTNVELEVSKKTASNGGQYLKVKIKPSYSVACTTDGKYYLRIGDTCKPILPEDLGRLFVDKPGFVWETTISKQVKLEDVDKNKYEYFIKDIRNSIKVSDFIKQKDDVEILTHYGMLKDDMLTNLGILWIGKQAHRLDLTFLPSVYFIKYDENENKINKYSWDDYSLNPKELISDIWEKIPYWKEGFEISNGIFGREIINHYNESVVREIITNALVHRPYNSGGDIFIRLYSNRLEVTNSGPLPHGITPQNILHKSVQRNRHLATIFSNLNLMEKEGSGYDKIFEIQLSEAKKLPVVVERDGDIIVTLFQQIIDVDLIHFIEKLKKYINLTQKEIISIGIIAQNKNILTTDFAKLIQLQDKNEISNWLGSLIKKGIVKTKGKTKGTEYFINPAILKNTELAFTNLKGIEPHRLRELILTDIADFGESSIGDINNRIGKEIPIRKVRACLYELVDTGELKTIGSKKFRKYLIDRGITKY